MLPCFSPDISDATCLLSLMPFRRHDADADDFTPPLMRLMPADARYVIIAACRSYFLSLRLLIMPCRSDDIDFAAAAAFHAMPLFEIFAVIS